jgi:hypothetical protein
MSRPPPSNFPAPKVVAVVQVATNPSRSRGTLRLCMNEKSSLTPNKRLRTLPPVPRCPRATHLRSLAAYSRSIVDFCAGRHPRMGGRPYDRLGSAMRNGAGIRPPSSSGASGCGWGRPGGSRAGTAPGRSHATCGWPSGRCADDGSPGGRRDAGAAVPGAGVAGAAEPAAVGAAGGRTEARPAGARVRRGSVLLTTARVMGEDLDLSLPVQRKQTLPCPQLERLFAKHGSGCSGERHRLERRVNAQLRHDVLKVRPDGVDG